MAATCEAEQSGRSVYKQLVGLFISRGLFSLVGSDMSGKFFSLMKG